MLLAGVVGPVLVESFEPGLEVSRFEVLIVPPNDGRPMRETGLGGCGNAAMLTERRMVLSVAATFAVAVFSVGTEGVEAACCWNFGTGNDPLDGVLNLDGVWVAEGRREDKDGEGRLFLVFVVGSGGRAEVGGSNGGCKGLGRAVAIAP